MRIAILVAALLAIARRLIRFTLGFADPCSLGIKSRGETGFFGCAIEKFTVYAVSCASINSEDLSARSHRLINASTWRGWSA